MGSTRITCVLLGGTPRMRPKSLIESTRKTRLLQRRAVLLHLRVGSLFRADKEAAPFPAAKVSYGSSRQLYCRKSRRRPEVHRLQTRSKDQLLTSRTSKKHKEHSPPRIHPGVIKPLLIPSKSEDSPLNPRSNTPKKEQQHRKLGFVKLIRGQH